MVTEDMNAAPSAEVLIRESMEVLRAVNVPREQQNERSALTLLALLGMRPGDAWSQAADPLVGITEMMAWFVVHFGRKYAPNTRETVRRFTVHQFVQMGLVLENPDKPGRPTNSPHFRCQVAPDFLALVRRYSSPGWKRGLSRFLRNAQGLKALESSERKMRQVPVTLPDGTVLCLTSGGQNVLVQKIVELFCPTFTPGGTVIYVGDTGNKRLFFEADYLRKKLGVSLNEHGKMPDVMIHLADRNWLVLVEAVTSHGPISQKRHNELKSLFKSSRAGLVYVTAFLNRSAMTKHLKDIAWETEVWVADAPSHLIHFNGERFLGPYV